MEETAQPQPTAAEGYNKRPLWQWLVFYVIIGAIIYAGIYYFFLNKNGYNYNKSSNNYPNSSQSPSPTSAMMSKENKFTLKPVNGSNEAGTVILTEGNGQTKVTISLTGYTKDVEQPAHIHIGICPGVGVVKYPLTPVVNGTSITILPVTLAEIKKELPLAINVHKSKTEIANYTACGPLNLQ